LLVVHNAKAQSGQAKKKNWKSSCCGMPAEWAAHVRRGSIELEIDIFL